MVPPDPNRRSDQILSFEGGVDAGLPPALILPNQNGWAVNTTHRGGWPTPRPGIMRRALDFGGNNDLRTSATAGLFQGAGTYISDSGRSYIAMSVAGRIFTIDLQQDYMVKDITIPGDPNMPRLPKAWFQQAEGWLVVQNAKNPAFLYNGAGSRRAEDDEVPVGGPMAYGKGRLWVARKNLLYGGDAVWSDPELGRNSVIKFTENTFIAEGGAFAIPGAKITGLDFVANLDTGLGEHTLLIYSFKEVQGLDVPVDRTQWINLQYPALTYVVRDFGSVNDAIVRSNSDHFYRSHDGIRSIAFARRDFRSWGNTPISRQIGRAMEFDGDQRLYACSGVNFDNRVMFTIGPNWNPSHGMWHNGLVVLDFNLITGMGRKTDPAWEGIWTGVRILQILTVEVSGALRCFILALSASDRIELWEVTKNRKFDFDGNSDVAIDWTLELRQQSFQNPKEFKRLESMDFWVDQMQGDISMNAFYRTDGASCWQPFATWNACVDYTNCDKTEECFVYPNDLYQPVRNYQTQERPRQSLPSPPNVTDQQTGGLTRDGYLFQVRLEMSGQMRLKMTDTIATVRPMGPFGDMRNSGCVSPPVADCAPTDCAGVECCPRNDYSYDISVEGGADNDDSTVDYPYPVDYPDGGGGGEEGETPEIAWDGNDPTGNPPPTGSCDAGEVVLAGSQYVWGLLEGENPNELISPQQLSCYAALLELEIQDFELSYLSAGYSVTRVSLPKWIYTGTTQNALSGYIKTGQSCNPNDGVGDTFMTFGGYVYAAILICVVAPAPVTP